MLSKSEILVLISNSGMRGEIATTEQKMGLVRDTEAAVLAKMQAQSEPVAWMTPMGNVFAKHQLTEAQKADLRPLYTHPAPVQQEPCGYDESTGNCTNNPCCRAAPVQQEQSK